NDTPATEEPKPPVPGEAASNMKLEGYDSGAIGGEWVLARMKEVNQWPPVVPALLPDQPNYNASQFTHPDTGEKIQNPCEDVAEIRRNMIMVVARLNSIVVNGSKELQTASAAGLVDGIYFRESMGFRQRCTQLLEMSLQFAVQSRQHRLVCTLVECLTMFKIGINSCHTPGAVNWFRAAIQKQYGPEGIPSIKIMKGSIISPNQPLVAKGDEAVLTLEFERPHAQAFLQSKIAAAKVQNLSEDQQKQFLSAYREPWWFILTAVNEDDQTQETPEQKQTRITMEKASAKRMGKPYVEKEEEPKKMMKEVMVLAWPLVVQGQDIGKKEYKVQIKFGAPPEAGRWTFYCKIKSSEFIGSDVMAKIAIRVVEKDEQAAAKKAATEKIEKEELDKITAE
ncbi:hypothetical protein ScalyP_jg230, partial [Parmales sp. scaly parma]